MSQGFGHNDGSVLYCMLRINKPRRMIEVGMGYSTMLSSMALKQNAEKDGKPCQMTSVEYENLNFDIFFWAISHAAAMHSPALTVHAHLSHAVRGVCASIAVVC